MEIWTNEGRLHEFVQILRIKNLNIYIFKIFTFKYFFNKQISIQV